MFRPSWNSLFKEYNPQIGWILLPAKPLNDLIFVYMYIKSVLAFQLKACKYTDQNNMRYLLFWVEEECVWFGTTMS